MNELAAFGYGMAGGCAAEALKFFLIRDTLHEGWPLWAKSWRYWIVTAVMSLLGGFLVLLYVSSGTSLTPLVAFNLGISAPLLIGKVTEKALPPDPGRIK